MEDVKKMIMQISQDISEQHKQMTKNITEKVENIIDEKFASFEIRNTEIIDILDNQESRIDALEREVRKKNIIIFGVEESETNYMELEQKVLSIMNEIMKINCTYRDLLSVRRLGRKSEKIRPILFTVHALRTKYEIFKNKKALENKKYYVTEDYPPKILAKRKLLREEVTKLREEGTKAIIKYDRIVILNTNLKNKRKFTESPEQQNLAKSEQNLKKLPKKLATHDLTSYVSRQPRPGK